MVAVRAAAILSPSTEAACGRRDPHSPHAETGTMLGAHYSHNCNGLAPEPRPPHVLRLTGEQIGSIDPPPEGDWFTDWDEYEDYVPARMLAEARAALLAELEAGVLAHEEEGHAEWISIPFVLDLIRKAKT